MANSMTVEPAGVESASHPILTAYTRFHTLLSLAGIAAGFVVMAGMLAGNPLPGWTQVFLWTTIATSVTGFFFPYRGFRPSYVFGIISLAVLAVTLAALYKHQLAGNWRWIYVVTAVFAQYLNFFVLIVQSFQKVPALRAKAPTLSEPPFKRAQLTALAVFLVWGWFAVVRF